MPSTAHSFESVEVGFILMDAGVEIQDSLLEDKKWMEICEDFATVWNDWNNILLVEEGETGILKSCRWKHLY